MSAVFLHLKCKKLHSEGKRAFTEEQYGCILKFSTDTLNTKIVFMIVSVSHVYLSGWVDREMNALVKWFFRLEIPKLLPRTGSSGRKDRVIRGVPEKLHFVKIISKQ